MQGFRGILHIFHDQISTGMDSLCCVAFAPCTSYHKSGGPDMIKLHLFLIIVSAILVLAPPGTSQGETINAKTAGNQLDAIVLSSGGLQGSSQLHLHQGTLGQPHPIGTGSSTESVLWSGFWRVQRSHWTSPILELPPLLTNRLWPNSPNPFNPRTTIKFSITEPAYVELAVFDVRGTKVRTLVSQEMLPGIYSETWDGRIENGSQAASGVYLYRLRNGIHQQTAKMLLVK